MTHKTQMSLIKVIIKSNYKNSLLTLLSNINTVHIKSKTKKGLKVEKDRPFAEKVKNLRQSLDALFKKLRINESDFQDLKFKKDERIEFIVKDLQELLNHALLHRAVVLRYMATGTNCFFVRASSLDRRLSQSEHILLDTALRCCKYLVFHPVLSASDYL